MLVAFSIQSHSIAKRNVFGLSSGIFKRGATFHCLLRITVVPSAPAAPTRKHPEQLLRYFAPVYYHGSFGPALNSMLGLHAS